MAKTEELKKAFEALGIKDASVAGTASEGGAGGADDIDILKAQVDTLTTENGEKDARIVELEAKLEKAVAGETLVTAPPEELTKGLESIGVIMKGMFDLTEKQSENIELLTKAVDEKIENVLDVMDGIADDIEAISKQPNPRRSVSGVTEIRKAFELNPATSKKVLSKGAHRKEIISVLEDMAGGIGKESTDKVYADACVRFETSGELTKAIIDDLNTKRDIEIIN